MACKAYILRRIAWLGLVLFVTATASFFLTRFTTGSPIDAESYFNRAEELYRQGRLEDAVNELREGIKLRPDYPEAHNNLGLLLSDLKHDEEAEREYREALRLRPDDPVVHYNLGNVLVKLKRHDDAEREYREALKLKPDDPLAHNNLGLLLKELKRYEEAEREYREALKLRPDYPLAHNNLGVLLKELKRYDEAEKEYREALRPKPDFLGAHYNLGNLLKELKRYGEAEKEYGQALEIDQESWPALWGLSEVHVEMAKVTSETDLYQDALTEIDRALRITGKNPSRVDKKDFLDMYLLRGYIHTALGDYEDARWDYNECKKYDEGNLKVHRNLRRINKTIKEQASLRCVQITVCAVAVAGLIGLYVGLFPRRRRLSLSPIQFTVFASFIFVFIMLGILLPIVTRIKVGKVEMEFEKVEKTITSPSVER